MDKAYYKSYHQKRKASDPAYAARRKEATARYVVRKGKDALRDMRLKHAETCKFYVIKRKYGLTRAQWEAMVIAQDGECAICENMLDLHKNTHVDHCHYSNAVRAILCVNCNHGIGAFRDSQELLRRAASYLDSFQDPK